MLVGDWNAHHSLWSVDGSSSSRGRVLAEWVQEKGAELRFGQGYTFTRRRGGGVVQSRIDFAVLGGGALCGEISYEDGLSDHKWVGGRVRCEVEGPLQVQREVIDWDMVEITVGDGSDDSW